MHTRILMSASFITWAGDLQPFEKKKKKNPPTLLVIICDLEKGAKLLKKKKPPPSVIKCVDDSLCVRKC